MTQRQLRVRVGTDPIGRFVRYVHVHGNGAARSLMSRSVVTFRRVWWNLLSFQIIEYLCDYFGNQVSEIAECMMEWDDPEITMANGRGALRSTEAIRGDLSSNVSVKEEGAKRPVVLKTPRTQSCSNRPRRDWE